MKTLKNIIATVILIFATVSAFSQTTCTATAPAKVGINEAIQYTVKLNEKPSKIVSQEFGTFTLAGGPSQGSSTSISFINGQQSMKSEYSYTYTLKPSKLGEATIPGVTFLVNGKQVKSNAVTVTVTQENQRQQQQQRRSSWWDWDMPSAQPQQQKQISKDDVILKASASKTNPYEGEEVVITHKLYLGSSISNFQPTGNEFPSQPDLWTYTLGNPEAEAKHTVETLNGKRYDVYELRKTAVYPQKTGEITITPLELEGVVTIPSGWFGRQEKMNLKSNSVTLNVKPLPQGKPMGFSGLVGKFTIKSSLTKSELATNDATNLVITVSGSGNIQHIEDLNIAFPTDFDVTDPAISDRVQTGGSSVSGSRSFEYVIIPRAAGTFTIPAAEFSYFDLATHSYKTLTTEAYTVTVAKGAGDENTVEGNSFKQDIQILDKDIRYIKSGRHAFMPAGKHFFGTLPYYIFLFLPLFLFVLLLIVWRKRIQNRENVAHLRDRRANKVARKSLKKAKVLLAAGKEEEFYVEISRALWGYMSDKFHIPLADLSMDTVRSRLGEKGVADEDIEEFVSTLNECEFARFAPNSGHELMNRLYDLSLQFITKIEKK